MILMMILYPAKRKKNYIQVNLEGEFIGIIPQKIIPLDYSLQTEITCSEEFIHQVKEWVYNQAQNLLLDFLAKAERCVFDCKMFLHKNEIPNQVIKQVLALAEKKKWLSDDRYTERYIQEAICRGKSHREIMFKLSQKHIDTSLIRQYLTQEYNQVTQQEIIAQIIDKLLPGLKDLESHQKFEKIATVLHRKGFIYHDYEKLLQMKINMEGENF